MPAFKMYHMPLTRAHVSLPSGFARRMLSAVLRAVFNLLAVEVWAALLLHRISTIFQIAFCH